MEDCDIKDIKRLLSDLDNQIKYKIEWKEMVQSPCEENGWHYEYLQYEIIDFPKMLEQKLNNMRISEMENVKITKL